MKSQKRRLRDLKENYAYGFVTGVAASLFAAMAYLRWILSVLYSYPPTLDYNWYSSVIGITTWLMILAFAMTFGGLMLGLSTIKESTLEADSLTEKSGSGQRIS